MGEGGGGPILGSILILIYVSDPFQSNIIVYKMGQKRNVNNGLSADYQSHSIINLCIVE